MGAFSTISPTSPIAATYKGFPADQDDWTCAQWKAYYENNKKVLGKAKALQIINIDTDNIGFFSTGQYCRYDADFVNYFENEGLNTGNVISKTYVASSNVVDAGGNTAKFVSGVTSSKPLMGVLLLGAGFLAYKYFFDGKK